jgi:hypothetical protein
MILNDVIERLRLRVLTSRTFGETEVTGGYTCDLLSDVMANGQPGNLWITIQTHQNILAVVRIKDLAGIIVVNGRQPDAETIRKADQENVTVLGTSESAFQVSGRLYRLLEES